MNFPVGGFCTERISKRILRKHNSEDQQQADKIYSAFTVIFCYCLVAEAGEYSWQLISSETVCIQQQKFRTNFVMPAVPIVPFRI